MRARLLLVASAACAAAGAVLATACGSSAPRTVSAPVATAASGAALPLLTLEQTGIIPAWMAASADPCQDFFAYACGGFLEKETIPKDRASWGATEELEKKNEDFLREVLERAAASAGGDPIEKKIGDYYASCIDEPGREKAGASPIAPLLAIATSPKDFATLADAVDKLHAAGVYPFFSVGSLQDFADATHVIAGLDQGGIGLPDRDYYLLDEPTITGARQFYVGHVSRMLTLSGMAPAEVKTATDDVMRVETKIARFSQDKIVRRDPHAVYHRIDREGLAKAAPTFPWDRYFSTLGIADVKQISVNDPAYFGAVDALLHGETVAALRHYLVWRVLEAEATRLSRAFVDEAFAMAKELTGQEELSPLWKRCVQSTDGALGELLGQAYVAARFAGDSKQRAQAVVSGIHAAMKAELGGLSWMDKPTRAAALEKLAQIADKVGYPDQWRVYDFDVRRESYAENAMASDRFEFRRDLAKIGKPVDRTEWLMTPPTVNAYYDPSLNEVAVPAGQLQPPFFSRDYYPPVNFGEIGGNTVGHELTHAFDDEGAEFDGHGNLRDWWTQTTKAKFDASTKCVQDQYSQYDAVPGMKLNGALTSGENIADIGGVKLGYAALEAWEAGHPGERRAVAGFTDEKLYFLAYAQGWCTIQRPESLALRAHTDPHSPARFRVNGPMVDVPAFAAAYACKPGSPMNTGTVCSVW